MPKLKEIKQQRLLIANGLLEIIGQHGRRFFYHKGIISRLESDQRGRIYFIDSYTNKKVYLHTGSRWRGFTGGGTLRSLIEYLRDFIRTGKTLPKYCLGPWPDYLCDGDLWGYGEDMDKIRNYAIEEKLL
jgi:hypothetical protein